MATWGFLDRVLRAKARYPIQKCFDQVRVATEREAQPLDLPLGME